MEKDSSRYVDITKKQFEDFLRKDIKERFSLKQGTKGVYIVHISDNVGLAISSSIGNTQSKRKGQASIRLSFVSLHKDKFHQTIYGYRKIMAIVVKKKHIQRSQNWRATLKDAVKKCLSFYDSSEAFLERIALPEQLSTSPVVPTSTPTPSVSNKIQEEIEMVESISGWETNSFLSSLHKRLIGGRPLSEKQLAVLESIKTKVVAPKYSIDLESLRDLYRTLSQLGATSDELESLAEIGQKVRSGTIGLSDYKSIEALTTKYNVRMPSYTKVSNRVARWNKVQVGNKVSEIYYRGIPTGSIQKVVTGYEAFVNNLGKQQSIGVFNSEKQAFNKIKKVQKG